MKLSSIFTLLLALFAFCSQVNATSPIPPYHCNKICVVSLFKHSYLRCPKFCKVKKLPQGLEVGHQVRPDAEANAVCLPFTDAAS